MGVHNACEAYSLDNALVDGRDGEFTVEVDCSLSELPSSILSTVTEDDSVDISAPGDDP